MNQSGPEGEIFFLLNEIFGPGCNKTFGCLFNFFYSTCSGHVVIVYADQRFKSGWIHVHRDVCINAMKLFKGESFEFYLAHEQHHPSIFCSPYSTQGSGEPGVYPMKLWTQGRGHPGQTNHKAHTLTHSFTNYRQVRDAIQPITHVFGPGYPEESPEA